MDNCEQKLCIKGIVGSDVSLYPVTVVTVISKNKYIYVLGQVGPIAMGQVGPRGPILPRRGGPTCPI